MSTLDLGHFLLELSAAHPYLYAYGVATAFVLTLWAVLAMMGR